MLLLHDDFKKNPHVCLCCCRVKLFRRCFVHCRVCLAIADCGKPVRCNDAFVNEVFLDSICSSFTQLLVVDFSAGSRGIPCNADFSFRVIFQHLDVSFQDRLRFRLKCRLIEIEMYVLKRKDNDLRLAATITFSSTIGSDAMMTTFSSTLGSGGGGGGGVGNGSGLGSGLGSAIGSYFPTWAGAGFALPPNAKSYSNSSANIMVGLMENLGNHIIFEIDSECDIVRHQYFAPTPTLKAAMSLSDIVGL